MGKRIAALLERTPMGRRAVRDGRFRTMLLACAGLCVNLACAVFNGVLGIAGASYWFITLFAYYAALAVMRFYIVTYEFRGSARRTEASVLRFCGGWICFLAVVLSGIVCLTISTGRDGARQARGPPAFPPPAAHSPAHPPFSGSWRGWRAERRRGC